VKHGGGQSINWRGREYPVQSDAEATGTLPRLCFPAGARRRSAKSGASSVFNPAHRRDFTPAIDRQLRFWLDH
jgi:hypothetical protein